MSTPQLYACLRYLDVDAVIPLLEALGFTERAIMRDPDDPRVVHHAQFRWREHGGIMFGTERADGAVHNTGHAAAYVVVDDPDAVFAAAVAAGATVERPMVDQGYGGRGGSVADPEGNHWSFGDYQPG